MVRPGKSLKCQQRQAESGEWGILKTSAITSGTFDPRENKYLQAEVPASAFAPAKVQPGDLLFCRASGSKGLAGMCAIVGDLEHDLLLSDKTIRVPLMCGVSSQYVAIHNASRHACAYYDALQTGKSTSMNNVTRPELLEKPVPLPPLAEQTAIATRVALLRSTCDTLDREIARSAAHATALLRAVLREAFAPALDKL